MASMIFDESEKNELSAALHMNMCFIETGQFKLRRNDAIEMKNYACIKKTTLDDDKLLITIADAKAVLERASPGRRVDLDEDLIPILLKAVRLRMAFTETGSSLRRTEVEKYNKAVGEVHASRQRPLLALTSTQTELLEKMCTIEARLADVGFSDVTSPTNDVFKQRSPMYRRS